MALFLSPPTQTLIEEGESNILPLDISVNAIIKGRVSTAICAEEKPLKLPNGLLSNDRSLYPARATITNYRSRGQRYCVMSGISNEMDTFTGSIHGADVSDVSLMGPLRWGVKYSPATR